MPSINDWASKCAAYIATDRKASVERLAAIIATFAEPLVTLVQESKRAHRHYGDDTYYCCPRCDHGHERVFIDDFDVPCDCGADEWNKRVDDVRAGK